MRAAVLHEFKKPLALEDVPRPLPEANEVLIRVEACGVYCELFGDLKKKFIPCATSTFRSRPFHFVAQSIVPGSGVGGGGRYSHDFNENNGSQDTLQATSLITIRKFWYAELKFTTIRAITADWNKSG